MKYLKPRNIVNSTTIVQKAIIAGGAAGNHNVAAIRQLTSSFACGSRTVRLVC